MNEFLSFHKQLLSVFLEINNGIMVRFWWVWTVTKKQFMNPDKPDVWRASWGSAIPFDSYIFSVLEPLMKLFCTVISSYFGPINITTNIRTLILSVALLLSLAFEGNYFFSFPRVCSIHHVLQCDMKTQWVSCDKNKWFLFDCEFMRK